MWSEYTLDVVDAVARTGSFSAAAEELHRVPSAISYSVRQLEQLAALRKSGEPEQPKPAPKLPRPLAPELKELEGRMQETLGLRATLTGNAKKGRIVLQYYSQDELERLYELLEKLRNE